MPASTALQRRCGGAQPACCQLLRWHLCPRRQLLSLSQIHSPPGSFLRSNHRPVQPISEWSCLRSGAQLPLPLLEAACPIPAPETPWSSHSLCSALTLPELCGTASQTVPTWLFLVPSRSHLGQASACSRLIPNPDTALHLLTCQNGLTLVLCGSVGPRTRSVGII